MKYTLWVVFLSFLVLSIIPMAAHADLQFDLDTQFSDGGTDPEGTTPPWLSATFVDTGANMVQLTMDASGLVEVEWVDDWFFNFDPNLTLTALSIDYDSGQAAGTVLFVSPDAHQADGDGKFDIKFDFPSQGFTKDKTSVYDIAYSGTGTMDELSFNFESVDGGGEGAYKSAAHVQAIDTPGSDDDDEQSGWIGGGNGLFGDDDDDDIFEVPEPSTLPLILLGGGLCGLMGLVGYVKLKLSGRRKK